jgi:hypothetical protein
VQIPSRTRPSAETVVAAATVSVATEAAAPAAGTEAAAIEGTACGTALEPALPAEALPPRADGDDAVRAVRLAGAPTEATVTPALAAISPAVSAAEPAKSARIPMVHQLRFWNAGRP